jgi:hypothetical protein
MITDMEILVEAANYFRSLAEGAVAENKISWQ